MVTSTNLNSPSDQAKDTVSGYLFPDGKYFSNISLSQTESFIRAHLLPEDKVEVDKQQQFQSIGMDHPLILICGHAARDARCGAIAPLLVAEFKAVLEKHGLLYKGESGGDKYEVGICSHIGGHVVSSLYT